MKHESRITLPVGVSEEELLGLMEGVLPAERAAAVRSKVQAGGGAVAKLLNESVLDRAAAKGLTEVAPPVDLVRAAMTRISREFEAAESRRAWTEPETATLPVSRVIPDRGEGVLARVFGGVMGRRLALAAGVLLAAGAGVWGIGLIVSGLWPERTRVVADGGMSDSSAIDAGASALAMETPDEPERPLIPEASATVLAASDIVGPVLTEASLSDMLSVSSDRAAALAAEGRLALTVRVVSAREALAKVDALARERGEAFRLGGRVTAAELPVAMASLSTPSDLPWDNLPAPLRPSAPVLASDSAAAVGAAAPAAARLTGGASVRAVYRAAIGADADALADLRARVSDAVGASSEETSVLTLVFYRELPASIAEPPSGKASEVLWWTQPAGRWAKRVSVPVVIEE